MTINNDLASCSTVVHFYVHESAERDGSGLGGRHLSKKKQVTSGYRSKACGGGKPHRNKALTDKSEMDVCGYTEDHYANRKPSTEKIKVQSMEVKTAGFTSSFLLKSLVYQNKLNFKAGKMHQNI